MLFSPVSKDVKRLHVPFADIFEATEVASQPSFAGDQLAVQKVHGDPPVCRTVDAAEPAKLEGHEQGKHAEDPGTSEDLGVWDAVIPLDTQVTWKAAHVECAESFFLPGAQGPGLTAVQKSAEDTGSVYYHLSVGCQFAVLLCSLCQSIEEGGRSTNSPVDLSVEREVVRDGGAEVFEPVHGLQFVAVDCDQRRLLSSLAHHVCLLQADGQAEVFAGP